MPTARTEDEMFGEVGLDPIDEYSEFSEVVDGKVMDEVAEAPPLGLEDADESVAEEATDPGAGIPGEAKTVEGGLPGADEAVLPTAYPTIGPTAETTAEPDAGLSVAGRRRGRGPIRTLNEKRVLVEAWETAKANRASNELAAELAGIGYQTYRKYRQDVDAADGVETAPEGVEGGPMAGVVEPNSEVAPFAEAGADAYVIQIQSNLDLRKIVLENRAAVLKLILADQPERIQVAVEALLVS